MHGVVVERATDDETPRSVAWQATPVCPVCQARMTLESRDDLAARRVACCRPSCHPAICRTDYRCVQLHDAEAAMHAREQYITLSPRRRMELCAPDTARSRDNPDGRSQRSRIEYPEVCIVAKHQLGREG
jgi:hypothetical protein